MKDTYTISAYNGQDEYTSPDWSNPKTWLQQCNDTPLAILADKPGSLKKEQKTTIFGGTTTNNTYEMY